MIRANQDETVAPHPTPHPPSWSELFLFGSLVSLWFGENPPVSDKDNRPTTELLLQLTYQPHLRDTGEEGETATQHEHNIILIMKGREL